MIDNLDDDNLLFSNSNDASVEEIPSVPNAEKYSIPEDGRAWYVVHCYSGYENKVHHSIEQRIETMGMQDMIFDVVVPT
jgi:transcriptional antiterminator NusG